MDELVAKAKIQLGNVFYTLGRYPNNILFHKPWFAYDMDLLAHLKACGINYNETNAKLLNSNMKKVTLMFTQS